MENTIENYLKNLIKMCNSGQAVLDERDNPILSSIARQVSKGTALTDRQYDLVKEKLVKYKKQFESINMNNLDIALENLDMPLRTIDRSQTIFVEDNMLVIKFPFNKKNISQLDAIANKYRRFYKHERNTNEHRFQLYEPLVYDVVELFRNKKFTIDPWLLEASDEIKTIKSQEQSFIPKVTVDGLVNTDPRVEDLAVSEIGPFSRENRIKYWDRSIRYGYSKDQRYFDTASPLAENIANRDQSKMYVNPKQYSLQTVVDAINELDRFPLLVTLRSKKEFEDLKDIFNAFSSVDPQQQILLDRVKKEDTVNNGLNTFIKEKNFNNWLDKDIKIVYIFKSSLPKLLVKGDWRPTTHFSLSGERAQSIQSAYISEFCDLDVAVDAMPSYWDNRFTRQLNEWV